MEPQTPTLQRKQSIRPGLTWTQVSTRSSFTPATSAATLLMLLRRRQMAGRKTTAQSSVTFNGPPTGPVQWQLGVGGDGFYSRIDPVGTGTSLRFLQGNNGGSHSVVASVTAPISLLLGAAGYRAAGVGDTQVFHLPYDLFHGGIPGGDDCPPAGVPGGCGHLVVGTTTRMGDDSRRQRFVEFSETGM